MERLHATLVLTEVGIVCRAAGEIGDGETPEVLVIVTAIVGVSPVATLPNTRFVGVTLTGEMPVPVIVIAKFSALMPIVALADFAPTVVG